MVIPAEVGTHTHIYILYTVYIMVYHDNNEAEHTQSIPDFLMMG